MVRKSMEGTSFEPGIGMDILEFPDDMFEPSTSKPLHVQRLEQALDMNVLEQQRSTPPTDEVNGEDDFFYTVAGNEDILSSCDDLFKDYDDLGENPLVNAEFVDMERSWLTEIMQKDVGQSDIPSNPAEDISMLMKLHQKHKKVSSHTNPAILEQHMYYGSGIISNFDKYPENKKSVQGKAVKRKREEEIVSKSNSVPDVMLDMQDDTMNDMDHSMDVMEELYTIEPPVQRTTTSRKSKAKKFKDEESKKKWEDMMHLKRRKLFSNMIKKEVGKQQRAKVNRHKEALLQNKKLALACQKVQRVKALQSARVVKELQWRMKRLSRENIAYWKRSKRVDREIRRKLEKEAEEQRKIDFELVEAKRQQRKLNFLITQTELYAHFMSKKLGDNSPEEQLRILSQLDEEKNPRLINIDDYDSDMMKAKAIKNAQDAFQNERDRTRQFDMDADVDCHKVLDTVDGEFAQPAIFKGTLKAYQLRGMNWLANLYDQGISGILADEMGLGKTVQSIAFLSHLAEVQDLWGPFLVICPASTLHNWQQEFAKFVPSFKVVPYWGNPADRKILRQFWHQDGMHTKDAGFHVVITSYQIVISDVKYFNRIKWQYMVLDEAQAIKSTSSMRWKTLLGFNCRNRLLLSGTPIQNSMAELWALLHFIMPTLFDSHEEFNEWFSKDIESHAENKTGIDEKHLSRLHMILKPFMLRRIKKDVENELSDKIEIMVYCPLTTRQRLLYLALKQKIHIDDLLHYTVGGGDSHSVDKNFTSNLMNLVMQFRKVCNHPELFERRDAKSPIYFTPLSHEIPNLVYNANVRKEKACVVKRLDIFSKQYISSVEMDPDSIFNFMPQILISPQEMYQILQGDIVSIWLHHYKTLKSMRRDYHSHTISDNLYRFSYFFLALFKMSIASYHSSPVMQELLFTWGCTASQVIYTFSDHIYHSMPETIEHRNIRCRMKGDDTEIDDDMKSIHEFMHRERKPKIFECEKTELPSFLFCSIPKAATQYPSLYCYSRRAAYDYKRHLDDWSWSALNYNWTASTGQEFVRKRNKYFHPQVPSSPVQVITPVNGWSNITIPDKETLVTDSGKLFVLDGLLKKMKEEGHRVLIYSQMTKMIDLLEEYMWHRHHKYMRLDGSSKISDRRDMVADFQARKDIFVFLLSTRAGGLGINLTAADTVIFYDSDWNPTVDQQAMDRAHRLGQTKQVTVYRLICKGSIEERILQRAREKSEIQNLVISGGNFKPETLKPKEVVSLLLDDEEIEMKYRQRAEERRYMEDQREQDRKRKYAANAKAQASVANETKKAKPEVVTESVSEEWLTADSGVSSPHSENSADVVTTSDDLTDSGVLDLDGWESSGTGKFISDNGTFSPYSNGMKPRAPVRGSTKRGRPRGSRRVSALGRFNSNTTPPSSQTNGKAIDVIETSTKEPCGSIEGNVSPAFVPYEVPVTASSSSSSGPASSSSTARRGPGRPRLKPTGPSNTGSRGTYRPRKPARPLPVPLPSDGSGTSSYSYLNFTEQSDS